MKRLKVDGFMIYIFPGVYEPAEDTYLLLEVINRRSLDGLKVLELCTGCGILAVAAALKGASVVAVDVDPLSAANAFLNARANGADNVEVICGDLCSAISQAASFDLVLANPPYLPSEGDRRWSAKPRLLGRLVKEAMAVLKDGGVVLLVESSLHPLPRIKGVKYSVVGRRRFLYEEVRVVEITPHL
ncbi:MAG TPA: methyltransferase domain-containing protein [Candidatus Methanomethylia archaeon]|nr:methyltransferase domain-containing protein [Candidatus Methanomethylicia archaeon]